MNGISRTDQSKQIERAGQAQSPAKEGSMHHDGHHSMGAHVLLCGLGMLAALGTAAVLGVNVAPLFCAAMMAWMAWGMAAPAIARRRHREQANQ
jgi:threonine/homoserine/homoserine lactone efflux protein